MAQLNKAVLPEAWRALYLYEIFLLDDSPIRDVHSVPTHAGVECFSLEVKWLRQQIPYLILHVFGLNLQMSQTRHVKLEMITKHGTKRFCGNLHQTDC